MMTSTTTTAAQPCHYQPPDEDIQYQDLLDNIRARFSFTTQNTPPLRNTPPPLFTTDATGLFDLFLDHLPPKRRAHYNCNACRRSVDRFGGLVVVTESGAQSSVMWDPAAAPQFFRPAVDALNAAVIRAKVTGVFLSEEKTWGLPVNRDRVHGREWHHMAAIPPAAMVRRHSAVQSTGQAIAEKLQDHGTLCRGLAEFHVDVVQQAHALLTTGNLYRSEKCIGVARWLLDLHTAREATKNDVHRENLTWLAVAKAPAGWCHVRSGMIGTLLEDIAAGLPFDDIKRRFDAKMDPLHYQRPQAPPSDGNLAQAEAIVQKLASAGALARRFAKLEDVEALWKPRPAAPEVPAPSGVFGHLRPDPRAAAQQIEQPPVTMTWAKFSATVLHTAETIDFQVPAQAASFAAMVTAANSDAPPILQWDTPERRNPVSWYLYHRGSPAVNWGLTPREWRAVTAVALQPSMWHPKAATGHHGTGIFFLLAGARDMKHSTGGGFFPETLTSEYHSVRRTIEAYANGAAIAGRDEATACGIALQGAGPWDYLFRVQSGGQRITYRIDRWD
jgi:hypothetical protein